MRLSPHRSALASFPDVLEFKVHPGGIFHKARVPRDQSRDVWIGCRYGCGLHDVMHAALSALRHVASRPLRLITDAVGSVAAVNFGSTGVHFTRDMDPQEGTCDPRPEGRLTSYPLSCHRVSVFTSRPGTCPGECPTPPLTQRCEATRAGSLRSGNFCGSLVEVGMTNLQ